MTVGRQIDRRLNRQSRYTFTCGRCNRCCREKLIQINPYEVARLAAHLGLTTTDFIRKHTCHHGAHLKFSEDNVCPFLTDRGCGVHPNRPLVCRLYPLGRHVTDTNAEWFSELVLDTGCAGVRGHRTSVLSYLKSQGALPFMRAADLYLALYWKLTAQLETEGITTGANGDRPAWADLDLAVSRYCAETRIPLPASLEERMTLHIRAIEKWAEMPARRSS